DWKQGCSQCGIAHQQCPSVVVMLEKLAEELMIGQMMDGRVVIGYLRSPPPRREIQNRRMQFSALNLAQQLEGNQSAHAVSEEGIALAQLWCDLVRELADQ